MARVMTNIISIRCPNEWEGLLNSETVRGWLLAYLADPVRLNGVPSPGSYKLNIRLSQAEFSALVRASGGGSMSAIVRGVIALNLSVPPKSGGWSWISTIFVIGLFLIGLFGRYRAAMQHDDNE